MVSVSSISAPANSLNYTLICIIAILLLVSLVLALIAIGNGSQLVKDGWFIPILVAQAWTLSVGLYDKSY